MDVMVDWVLKHLHSLHLTPLLQSVCCTDRGSLSQPLRQLWWQLQHLQQKFTSNVGKNGPVGVLKRVYQTMPFLLLNKMIFWLSYLGLDWVGPKFKSSSHF